MKLIFVLEIYTTEVTYLYKFVTSYIFNKILYKNDQTNIINICQIYLFDSIIKNNPKYYFKIIHDLKLVLTFLCFKIKI